MSFVKPPKLFLSYTRRDESDGGYLLHEFRNHLRGLEDDGVIQVWWDKEITAGTQWNDEIQRRLEESQIFLPLTSASFHSVPYVRDEELPRAWTRYDAGKCLITPVMWRQWKPPESSRLGSVQFLNDVRKAVFSAKDTERDDLLMAMAENLAKAIQGGQMPSARGVSKPAVPVPSDLPYLCDWTDPIDKLELLKPGSSPRPAVLVLLGNVEDCAEEFLHRVHRRDLPRKLGLPVNAPVHDIKRQDWPTAADSLLEEVRPSEALPLDKRLPDGLSVWRTTTLGWESGKEAILRDLLEDLRQSLWTLPATRGLVQVIFVINRKRDEGLASRIEAILRQVPEVPSAVITMPEIPADFALSWASHEEVRRRCRPGSHTSLARDILKLYQARRDRPMPMGRLARELLRLMEQYREKGTAA